MTNTNTPDRPQTDKATKPKKRTSEVKIPNQKTLDAMMDEETESFDSVEELMDYLKADD